MQLSVMRVTPYHTLQLTCCRMLLSCIKSGQSELSAFCLCIGYMRSDLQLFTLCVQYVSGLMGDLTEAW